MRVLQKYLFRFTSKEEEKELLDSSAVNAAFFDAWNNFNDIKSRENAPETDKILEAIITKANIPRNKKHIFSRYAFKVAALVTLLIGSGLISYLLFWHNPTVEVITKKGHKKELTLPDGSRVWLNSDTKISYRKKFSNKSRVINLSGEAYFSVIKENSRTFIVRTPDLEIKVLGTVFNVKSYPEDQTSETTLISGSLIIETNSKTTGEKPILLAPSQKAVYSTRKHRILIEQVASDKNTLWKNGKLIFDNEPVSSVLKKLERWYGMNVQLELTEEDTSLLNERYTIVVKDENIEEVIRLLQLTSPLTFRISNPDGSSPKILRPAQ